MIRARNLALEARVQCAALDLKPGTMVALVGPNGGGKTSLLRALAGVEQARGTVTIDGIARAAMAPVQRAAAVAFAPASRDLSWPVRVRDFLGLGLPRPDPERIDALLAQFELADLAHRPGDALSTGERARLLIARALAARPRLLLLDEPLGNLDPYWVLRVLEAMETAAREGACVVAALHELAHLPAFDRALLVADGRVLLDEAPAILMDDERFLTTFRLGRRGAGATGFTMPGDRRSSP